MAAPLRRVATHQGRPAAALIREAVRAYLAALGRPDADDPFAAIVGAYEGGPDAAALQHDRYLYGTTDAAAFPPRL